MNQATRSALLGAAATLAALLPSAALANNCYMVASYFNPGGFSCQDTGRRDVYGQKIFICCN